MKITTYDPKKRKVVLAGDLEADVFTKKVSSKHFMKLFQAYGIQEDVIHKLKEQNCKTIRLVTPTQTYEASLNIWLLPHIKVMDYGHGKQRFLGVKDMRKV